MLTRKELILAGKLLLIAVYAVTLYMATSVFGETYSVFDYARF
jgi:hypothetical protein